ncbi:hypothetical protein GH733_015872, partial [Mirounga leonina]
MVRHMVGAPFADSTGIYQVPTMYNYDLKYIEKRETNTFHVTPCITPARTHKSMSLPWPLQLIMRSKLEVLSNGSQERRLCLLPSMYKLISWCLLFIGCLHPLLSLPVPDSREESLQLSELPQDKREQKSLKNEQPPDGDARSALDELERVSLLQMLLEMSGAERGDGLREAEDTITAGTGSTDLWLLLHSSENSGAPTGRCCPHGPLLSPCSPSRHLQTSNKDGQTSC